MFPDLESLKFLRLLLLRLIGSFLFAFTTLQHDAPALPLGVAEPPSVLFRRSVFGDLTFQLLSCFKSFPAGLDFRGGVLTGRKLLSNFESLPLRLDLGGRLFLD